MPWHDNNCAFCYAKDVENHAQFVMQKLTQCLNLIDLRGPQWTRFLVKGNGALLRLQTKQTPFVKRKENRDFSTEWWNLVIMHPFSNLSYQYECELG